MRKVLASPSLCSPPARLRHAPTTIHLASSRIIVPYPAGGPTDTIARILAERMQTALGQTVIIENISGAGGSIGVGRSPMPRPTATR